MTDALGGFTGVVKGLYAVNAADSGKPCKGVFEKFKMLHEE